MKIRLYYVEGNDTNLRQTAYYFKKYILKDESIDIIYAGDGWHYNRSIAWTLLRKNKDAVVFSNDVNTLQYVAYDFTEHTFPLAFVDSKLKVHILKDVYENVRAVNSLMRMYQAGVFTFFDDRDYLDDVVFDEKNTLERK